MCFEFFLFFWRRSHPFSSRLSLGDSYHSGGCDLSSAGWVGGVLTLDFGILIILELGGSIPGVLACVVRWCTHGEVLMIDFYPRSKRGFVNFDFGTVIPTAVVRLAFTVFHVEVVGRQLFLVVVALGMLVPC